MNIQTPAFRAADDFCTHIRHPAGLPLDVRIITSPVTPLVLGTCLVDNVRHLMNLSEMKGPAAYLHFDPDAARTGETLFAPRRLMDHETTRPFDTVTQVIVIRSTSEWFGKDSVMALQAEIAARISDAGRCTLIQGTGHPAAAPQPGQRALLRRWISDLRAMIVDCGFFGLEPAETATARHGAPSKGFSVAIPEELLDGSSVERFRIERDGIRAECSRLGPWTVLHRGSSLRPTPISSYQDGLAEKRRALMEEGILVAGDAVGDPLTLSADVALPSMTNAARLVLGTNTSSMLWQPV